MSFAATQPFELQDLARNQTVDFHNRQQHLAQFRHLAALAVLPIASWAGRRVVLHYAHRFAQQAVWFSGAVSALERQAPDRALDPNESLRAQLNTMDADLEALVAGARRIASNLRASDGHARGRVRDALDRLAESAVSLRREVVAFRAALRRHDACAGVLRTFVVRLQIRGRGDYLSAVCEDVPGLHVYGKSVADVRDRAASAIPRLMRANRKLSVTVAPTQDETELLLRTE
jgi:hypothetical protein